MLDISTVFFLPKNNFRIFAFFFYFRYCYVKGYTVIFIYGKMAEIHLKMVVYAQFKFDHLFWSNFVQFGRILIHGWFVCADSGEILPVWKHFDQF
jgi:hypothetical protein